MNFVRLADSGALASQMLLRRSKQSHAVGAASRREGFTLRYRASE